MLSLVWLAAAVLLGCLLVYRWTGLAQLQPRWAGWLFALGAGAALGIGVTSCIFLAIGIGLRSGRASIAVEIAALAWSAIEAFRKHRRALPNAVEAPAAIPFPLRIPMAAALAVVIGTATIAIAAGWDANPHGNWDGWAIWNLRARFLAADPALAPRAWSAELGRTTHAEYPLLVSAFVARTWRYSGEMSTAAPAATSYVFWLALVAMLLGALSAIRGPSLGLVAALVLAATPALSHEVSAQYADIPLACYFAGSTLLALAGQPLAAGFFAGLAAWTKDEGLLFLAVFLIAMAIFRRQAALRALAGALPGALLALGFKYLLVQGNSSLVAAGLPGAAHRLADFSRWSTIARAYWREFSSLGQGWYHPILPLVALAIALRFDRARRRDVAFCASIASAVLAGDFAVYLITPNALDWQLQTSLGRLFVQVWPILVIAVTAGVGVPESRVLLREPAPARVQAKAKGRSRRPQA
jgi:hypothetical protein